MQEIFDCGFTMAWETKQQLHCLNIQQIYIKFLERLLYNTSVKISIIPVSSIIPKLFRHNRHMPIHSCSNIVLTQQTLQSYIMVVI